ncbi:class I adenylate-forming enzyme family protein [Actinomadura harenae]|uniref:Long-chain fatty acid--CoA ligase n=1 Tax=Actinomadura harenae TaxID=2483351 RepID=A0A3M2LV60_9ACTN|nr:fatty acid--CoA ligase family protein [Actinomadura harenae]RMI41384.1 long-chain fatty acid--CoA ligase [Actinomadura harenae]
MTSGRDRPTVDTEGIGASVGGGSEARASAGRVPRADGSFGEALLAGVRAAGAQEVLVRGTRRLTGAQVHAAAHALAARLIDHGVRPGDTVACLYGPHLESTISRLAAYVLNCPFVYLLPRMPFEDVDRVLRGLRVPVLMVDPTRRRQAEALTAGGFGSPCLHLEPWLPDERPPRLPPLEAARPEALASVLFSSGTTGDIKAITYSNQSEAAQFATARGAYGPSPWRFLVAPGPFLPDLMAQWAMATGGTAILAEDKNAATMVDLIHRERPRQCEIGRPVELYALADHLAVTGSDLGELRLLLYGGTPVVPARLAAIVERLPGLLMQNYGSSEAALIATLSPADHRRRELLGSVGRPVPDMEAKICDPDGTVLPPGRIGQLWVRSAQNMDGYLTFPAGTSSAPVDAGRACGVTHRWPEWIPTGDAGHLDDDGYLFLVGRLADRLPSGAYPQPLENSIGEHPAVIEAAVYALPDGSTAVAVVPRPGHTPNLADLRRLLHRSHPPRTHPRHLQLVDALPRTPAGKPDRVALRQLNAIRTPTGGTTRGTPAAEGD